MTIRWTQPANDDFLGIVAWIAARNPDAATTVGQRILTAVEALEEFPFRGRPGRSPDTRELALAGLPYCAHHSRVAYQPAADRRRQPPKPPGR